MKITNNFDQRLVIQTYLKQIEKGEQNKTSKVTQPDRADQADRAEISKRARELQMYKARLREMSDVRPEKVDSIKKQLEQGTYLVDEEKIATGILEEYQLDKKNKWSKPSLK